MRRGFSLVELSIVLVILGLLTGGILAGQSLIRASELRAVGSEYNRYITAVGSFRDKYFALPGDMNNATKFWGKDTAQCNADPAAAGTPGTCNGNGDAALPLYTTGANTTSEPFQFWKQLALAGLIEGSYSGNDGPNAPSNQDAVVGTNIPRSKISNAGWSALTLPGTPGFPGVGEMFLLDYGNALMFGAQRTGYWSMTAIIKPEEAWNIDTKMDDGIGSGGKIVGINWNDRCTSAATGVSSATNIPANYRISDNTIWCGLVFRKAF